MYKKAATEVGFNGSIYALKLSVTCLVHITTLTYLYTVYGEKIVRFIRLLPIEVQYVAIPLLNAFVKLISLYKSPVVDRIM